jgi:argininosuccinate lyase
MSARAAENFITVTELADTLARDEGLPFGSTHAIASRLIAKIRQQPEGSRAAMLAEVSKDVVGRAIDYSDAKLQQILSPAHFVEVRQTLGGPAPAVTAVAIEVSRATLDRDRQWLAAHQEALAASTRELRTEVDRL